MYYVLYINESNTRIVVVSFIAVYVCIYVRIYIEHIKQYIYSIYDVHVNFNSFYVLIYGFVCTSYFWDIQCFSTIFSNYVYIYHTM